MKLLSEDDFLFEIGESGDQGDQWNKKRLDFFATIPHRIVFEVIKGTVVDASDIALDDIKVWPGANCKGVAIVRVFKRLFHTCHRFGL